MKGLGLLWLLVALCATNWVLVKDSGGLDTLTFSALRFVVAAAAFAPFLPGVKSYYFPLVPLYLKSGVSPDTLEYDSSCAHLPRCPAAGSSVVSWGSVVWSVHPCLIVEISCRRSPIAE